MPMDYSETFCQAVDIIVAKRLSELKFDETIVCTVVDDSFSERGEYIVLYDNTLRFTAYAEEEKVYKKGNQVYVLVPQGDYSKDKIIQGRYSNKKEENISYVSPLEEIDIVEEIYSFNNEEGIFLQANDKLNLGQLLGRGGSFTKALPKDSAYLYIKADFKTFFDLYDIRGGSYGIQVNILTDQGVKYIFKLSSSNDMFGDPYNYDVYFQQEQAYQISLDDNDAIKEYSISFYQDSNFKYYDDKEQKIMPLPQSEDIGIFVNNIYICSGKKVESKEVLVWNEDTKEFDINKKYLISGTMAQKIYELLNSLEEQEEMESGD